MIVESDTETGAVYYDLSDVPAPVHRTVHLADLVMVDVNEIGEPLGVEFAAGPTDNDWALVFEAYPDLKATFAPIVSP